LRAAGIVRHRGQDTEFRVIPKVPEQEAQPMRSYHSVVVENYQVLTFGSPDASVHRSRKAPVLRVPDNDCPLVYAP